MLEDNPLISKENLIRDNLYNYPKYYDLVYGSDWKAEFNFLEDCFEKHTTRLVERLFEPACGTGRLMIQFAKAGYQVAGNDLNNQAVDYCNARLKRGGFPESAVIGDMSDYQVQKKQDCAFNMINSFRHLSSHPLAVRHLECTANALKKGGLYLLGIHLSPTKGEPLGEESWSAQRGNLAVVSHMQTQNINKRKRIETVGMRFDIYTPTRISHLTDTIEFRTYTNRQMNDLLAAVPQFEILETYDFSYDIDKPITVGPETEDVVYVLKKQ